MSGISFYPDKQALPEKFLFSMYRMLPEKIIWKYQACHGFSNYIDSGNGGDVVAAFGGDFGGLTLDVNRPLFHADGWILPPPGQ